MAAATDARPLASPHQPLRLAQCTAHSARAAGCREKYPSAWVLRRSPPNHSLAIFSWAATCKVVSRSHGCVSMGVSTAPTPLLRLRPTASDLSKLAAPIFFLHPINNPASQTQCPYSPPSSSKKDALSPQRAWRTGPWHGTARGSDESCGVEPHTAAPRGDSVFFWNCFVVDDVGSSASGSGYCGDSGNEEGSRAGTGSPTTGAVYS
jgi:hypothetical protein